MALAQIPAQARVKRFLRRLFKLQRVPHALLFTGIPGIGKKRLAVEFAKLLNCCNSEPGGAGDAADVDACDRCRSCLKIDQGQHPDFLAVRRQGAYIKLEQVRTLRERFHFSPFEGRYRVVVVEDAQDLKDEAANALLKLLEEPPEQNVFILLAPEAQLLLPTIASRCCKVRFQPLPNEEIVRHLVREHGVDRERATEVADFVGGSLALAEQWVEEERIGRIDEVLERISQLPGMSMIDFFATTEKWAKESSSLAQDLECIKFWLRKCIHAQVYGGGPLPAPAPGRFAGLEDTLGLLEKVDQAIWDLRFFANKQLTIESVCLQIKDLLHG